jgi:propanol-preferring alcohol dehydrogenase
MAEKTYDIPKTCKAGVVVNEGPDFKVEIEDVPVPTPGNQVRMPKSQSTNDTLKDQTTSS